MVSVEGSTHPIARPMKQNPVSSRPPKKEPLDALVGLIAGAIWGVIVSVSFILWVMPEGMLLVVGLCVSFTLVSGALGYFQGADSSVGFATIGTGGSPDPRPETPP